MIHIQVIVNQENLIKNIRNINISIKEAEVETGIEVEIEIEVGQ